MDSPEIRSSRALIESAKSERANLLRQIAESQAIIERSREIIVRLDQAIAHFERNK